MEWHEFVDEIHREADQDRVARGLPLWDWKKYDPRPIEAIFGGIMGFEDQIKDEAGNIICKCGCS